MTLGDLTIADYCHKLKVIFDLENIDQSIDEKTLVMHTVNGLSDKFENIATIIRHQKPLTSFLDTRAMLQLEESRLSRTRPQPAVKDSPLSPTVLDARGNNNNRNFDPQACQNYQRGHCQFGARCRFIHANPTYDPRHTTGPGSK